MRKGFAVTYEVITEESARDGDVADSGFLAEDATLSDALHEWDGIGCHVEADCYPVGDGWVPRWFTAYEVNAGTRDCFETGDVENRSLHLPDDITPDSALRIARLVGCYGIK